MRPLIAALLLCPVVVSRAAEIPSFMQAGDVFCTSERDFDSFVSSGHLRAQSSTDTCELTRQPTRVAVIGGTAGVKTMVRVMNGAKDYTVGWTNGTLPIQ